MTTVEDSSKQSECGMTLEAGCICRRTDAHDIHQCSYPQCSAEWRHVDGKLVAVTTPRMDRGGVGRSFYDAWVREVNGISE